MQKLHLLNRTTDLHDNEMIKHWSLCKNNDNKPWPHCSDND